MSFLVWSQFEFLSFVAVWVLPHFEFWALSQFEFLRLVTIWVFEFSCYLSFCVLSKFELSQFEFLSFVTVWVFFSFITTWDVDFSQLGLFLGEKVIKWKKYWSRSFFLVKKIFLNKIFNEKKFFLWKIIEVKNWWKYWGKKKFAAHFC